MLQQLQKKLLLSDEKWKEYLSHFQRMPIAAKITLLREGERAKKVYLVEKGCLRAWFNNDGKDVTFQFFFEGGVVSSVESFRKNIPSQVSLEAIEASVVVDTVAMPLHEIEILWDMNVPDGKRLVVTM